MGKREAKAYKFIDFIQRFIITFFYKKRIFFFSLQVIYVIVVITNKRHEKNVPAYSIYNFEFLPSNVTEYSSRIFLPIKISPAASL